AQQIVGRERRERISQLAWCGGGCFESRRRVNSTVMRLNITLETKPELMVALKSAAASAEEYFSQREACETAESIGASGSMFRVFRNVDKPSLHYKNWAFDQISSSEFEHDVLMLKSQDDFERFHLTLGG